MADDGRFLPPRLPSLRNAPGARAWCLRPRGAVTDLAFAQGTRDGIAGG